MTNPREWLDLIALAIPIVVAAGGIVAWYRSRVACSIEQKRDLNHLRRSVEQLSSNVEALTKDQDQRFDRVDINVSEMKSLLALLVRQGGNQ